MISSLLPKLTGKQEVRRWMPQGKNRSKVIKAPATLPIRKQNQQLAVVEYLRRLRLQITNIEVHLNF